MSAYFLRYFYVLMIFLTSTMGFCSIGHRSISEILTSNLVARINGGEIGEIYSKRTTKGETVYSNGERWFIFKKGEQPDLKTCAQESWAMHKVEKQTGFAPDKDEVTQWYCDMFLPKKDPISQLANAAGIQSSILNYDQSMSPNDIVLFENAFRKIASNPVGRMLLYRLLIEIYRPGTDGLYGKQEFNEEKGGILGRPQSNVKRDNIRQIFIKKGAEWMFRVVYSQSKARLFDGILCTAQSVRKEGTNHSILRVLDVNTHQLAEYIISSDEDDLNERSLIIFHELLHWFHAIRDILRYDEYVSNIDGKCLSEHDVFGQYWTLPDADNGNKIGGEGLLWKSFTCENKPDFEEIFTILGSNTTFKKYCHGDELSENAYRLSINRPLRYGHAADIPLGLQPMANYEIIYKTATLDLYQ